MPFVVLPVSDVPLSVLPLVAAVPVFFVHIVLSLVGLTFRPGVYSMAVHAPLEPATLVFSPVYHLKRPLALEKIIFPLSLIKISVFHPVFPKAVLLPFKKGALVRAAVGPCLPSVSVRHIPPPGSLVLASIFANKNPLAMCMVVHKIALVV